MANFYLNVENISRGAGRSVANALNYISGRTVHDSYTGMTYYRHRQDVLSWQIFQPDNAPSHFYDLQELCYEIDSAEKRYDARTARLFIGSLPNELPPDELTEIVNRYVSDNFTSRGLCAIAAIHKGINGDDPTRNNPHVHIIVSTRTVGPNGFNKKKYREHNQRKYILTWREQWAYVQNRAYERSGLDIRVSHESLEVQGIRDREPTIHMSRIDWQRERRGERTVAGDLKREIEARNKERARQSQLRRQRGLERSR